MKWILIVLGGLVALGVLVALIGLLLPREHRASSRVELRQPVDSVWAVIRDMGQVPTFWTELKTSARIPDIKGHEAWAQTMKNNFTLNLEIAEDKPPSRLVTRIDAPAGAPFGGVWIYQLEPLASGCRVTVTEDGWIANLIFRVVSKIMGYHGTLDGYLKALGRKFGEDVTPVHMD